MKAASTQNGKHRWYDCPRCGEQHPSVTTLLDMISSPPLMGWMAKNGVAKLNTLVSALKSKIEPAMLNGPFYDAEIAWKKKEGTDFWKSGKELGAEAADYGTMAHAWIEAHLQGKDISIEGLPVPVQNAVNQYLKWEKEHTLETIKTEETFFNCKLNYAGTADWVGNLDGKLSLGDWKSSNGVYLNYIIQGWCYALADETQNAGRLYPQIFIGRFGKDGSSEVRICRRNDFPSIETSRDIIIACGHIFQVIQQWEKENPYYKKPKEKITA